MVQDYIQFPQPQQSQPRILKPNMKKIYINDIFKILGSVLFIALLLLVINSTGSLAFFLDIFSAFGINISSSQIFLYFILSISSVTAILLVFSYLSALNIKYEFYNDKLIAYKSSFFIFTNSLEVPYQNIARISLDTKGLFKSLFNSGTVILELSGMKEREIKVQFIDNIPQAVMFIQTRIREHLSARQAQFTENYKIGNIMGRF